jgi:hypothetical protein
MRCQEIERHSKPECELCSQLCLGTCFDSSKKHAEIEIDVQPGKLRTNSYRFIRDDWEQADCTLTILHCSGGRCGICRVPCHVVYSRDCPGRRESRRRRITLLAKCAIAAAKDMRFADVVLACEGVLIVTRTLMERTGGAATYAMMHTGFHFILAFNHGKSVPRFLVTRGNSSHNC